MSAMLALAFLLLPSFLLLLALLSLFTLSSFPAFGTFPLSLAFHSLSILHVTIGSQLAVLFDFGIAD